MDNKMRVGRLHADGAWSGAIGTYLAAGKLQAESANDGRDEGRRSAPGHHTALTRARVLRVLSEVAREKGIEWVHHLQPEHFVEAKSRMIAEAKLDPRVRNELKASTLITFVVHLKAFARYCGVKTWLSGRQLTSILEYLPIPSTENSSFIVIPSSKWPEMFAEAMRRHLVEAVVLALGFYVLMRESEMSRLTWGDFDFAAGTVTFRRDKKNGASLTSPLAKPLIEILELWRTWLKLRFGVDEIPKHWHVVPARIKGAGHSRAMNPEWTVDPTRAAIAKSIQLIVKHAAKTAGYTDEELLYQAVHLLRRSGAEDLYQRGWDIRIIAELLGHGEPNKPNIEQTMRYLGHWVDLDKLRAAVNREDPNAIKARGIGQPVGTDLAIVQSVAVIDDARVKIAEWVTAGQLTIEEGLKIAALVAQG